MEVLILGEHGKVPQKANASDAGYDLFASQVKEIAPWTHELVKTDIAITVPLGTYGRIAPRSGLSLKNGIHVGAGVVDRGYTGPVGIVLFNLSDQPFKVNVGDRVAQLILEKIALDVQIKITPPNSQLEISTKRGAAGFGSSGINSTVADKPKAENENLLKEGESKKRKPAKEDNGEKSGDSSDVQASSVKRRKTAETADSSEEEKVTTTANSNSGDEGVDEGEVRGMKRRRTVGRLVMVIGPMFASKTTSLRAFAQRYALAKKNCLVVKFSKDNRYSVEQELITHDKLKVPASCVAEKLSEIPHWPYNQADVILIDEAHFYNGLAEFCAKATKEGKVVIAAGLVSTWDQKPFSEMCNLLAQADEVISLKAVCTNCGEDAIFTKRIVPSTQLQLIGGSDLYTARCRACYPL